MPYDESPTVDWSSGRVLLRNGSIFCSPNSKRAVSIPDDAEVRINPLTSNNPNGRHHSFNFFQPVWWNWSHGWIAFVPMSPSFIALPFQQLCWKPRVVETTKVVTSPSGIREGQRRYAVRSDDCQQWMKCEQEMARAADLIRMFHHIPGGVPPLPSSFGLAGLHRSRNVAEHCINSYRKYFVVWMGFLSYLIAQTTRPEYKKPASGPLPSWYTRLLERGFAPPWLDGLAGSSVCAFDFQTFRSGVLFSLTDNDPHRPPVQWFLAHHVPCWYPLSRFSEEYMKRDAFLRKLIPPPEMLQEELTKIFVEPRLPLVLFIIQGYRGFEWDKSSEEIRKILNIEHSSSEVLRICSNELSKHNFRRLESNQSAELDQILHEMRTILAEREDVIRSEIQEGQVCLQQGMVERDDFEGMTSLHADWSQFFEKRAKREVELRLSESDKDREARLQREKNRPIKKSKMYVWQAVKTSGGGTIFARTLMRKSEHEDLVEHYKPSETKFNARYSEWDFFEYFDLKRSENVPYEDSDESGSEPEWPLPGVTLADNSQQHSHIATPAAAVDDTIEFYATAPVEDYPPPSTSDTNMVHDSGTSLRAETRLIERAHWQFGFVPPLGQKIASPGASFSWKEVLHTLGSISADTEFVMDTDKAALQTFFSTLVSKTMISSDLDDLSDQNHSYLLSRASLNFVNQVGEKWFIFLEPRSTTSSWFLGVDNAAAVLYVLRILATTWRIHTMFTLGDLLIRNGVKFRTFERLTKAKFHTLNEPFRPQSYRQHGYIFTAEDFRASLLQTKYLLQTLPGRAALLSGGIIGRVAREFLQANDVLDGPSVEATFLRKGFCVEENDNWHEYWDDDLTEQERAIICGTYVMYTGSGEQITKISWFPPPQAWEGSSYDSLEWTPKAEEVFQSVFVNARRGEFQPLSAKRWRDRLRNFKTPRKAFENNRVRASNFLTALTTRHQ